MAVNKLKQSADVILSDSPHKPEAGPWKVALRVSPSEAWDMAKSDAIPVLENSTYRLSGWLYRTSPTDDVYVDMDDLTPSDNIYTSVAGQWQYVQGDINVGSAMDAQADREYGHHFMKRNSARTCSLLFGRGAYHYNFTVFSQYFFGPSYVPVFY